MSDSTGEGEFRDAWFVVGRRRSGKSAFMENYLARFSQRLYVGTLRGDDHDAREVIAEHQNRRGQGWRLVECSDCARDICVIERELEGVGPGGACMIDGLTNWAVSWSAELASDLLAAARLVAHRTAELLRAHPYVAWRLLDVPPEDFDDDGQPLHAAACRLIAATLHGAVPDLRLYVFKNGVLHERAQDRLGR
jgi:adenosyl cobinamide kinase/adenosyl cobinamide phosphate guanylyltransferase